MCFGLIVNFLSRKFVSHVGVFHLYVRKEIMGGILITLCSFLLPVFTYAQERKPCSTVADSKCLNVLSIRDTNSKDFFEGIEITGQDIGLPIPAEAKVYKLDDGRAGGAVFRVVESNGQRYIIKRYHFDYLATHDLAAMEIISEALKKNPEIPFDAVKMERIGDSSSRLVRISDIEGWDMSRVFKFATRENAVQFERALGDAKEMLIKAILKINPRAHRGLTADVEISVDDKNDIHFVFKPNNIVRNSKTGRMTIIDPF